MSSEQTQIMRRNKKQEEFCMHLVQYYYITKSINDLFLTLLMFQDSMNFNWVNMCFGILFCLINEN